MIRDNCMILSIVGEKIYASNLVTTAGPCVDKLENITTNIVNIELI
jgi:hypothetical protein